MKGGKEQWADMSGWTILHYACSRGHTDTVQVLLEKGASAAARNDVRAQGGMFLRLLVSH